MGIYIEGGCYGFVTLDDGGTEPACSDTDCNGAERKPTGWCVYIMERDSDTDEFVRELSDENFTTEAAALAKAAVLEEQHGCELEYY